MQPSPELNRSNQKEAQFSVRLNTITSLILSVILTGCSAGKKVPSVDPETPVVLQINQPFDQLSQFEISLSKDARIGLSLLVGELAKKGRPHTEITKTPLGIFTLDDHKFYWRGSSLYFSLSPESWVEIQSAALAEMASDLYERRSKQLHELVLPLERLALTR